MRVAVSPLKPSGSEVDETPKHPCAGHVDVNQDVCTGSGQRTLGASQGVVDLLDADPGNTWYVMRLADGDLNALRGGLSAADVVELFQQIGAGLSEAHEKGFLHRDLKPANVLRFGGRWAVADWGLVRRPRGETTSDRTKTGSFYGTEGFSAPEAYRDAHRMGPASDVYSLGQILGWIPDGAKPVPNLPPANPGRWSVPVRSATQMDPEHRPSLEDFILAVERAGAPPPPAELVEEMGLAASEPGSAAKIDAGRALALARQAPDQRMLFDVLPRLVPAALRRAIQAEPALAADVARAYAMSGELEWGRRDFDYANDVVETVLLFAHEAAELKNASLLSVATSALLELDEVWDRYRARDSIRGWLAGLSGEGARVVAKVLREPIRLAEAGTWGPIAISADGRTYGYANGNKIIIRKRELSALRPNLAEVLAAHGVVEGEL